MRACGQVINRRLKRVYRFLWVLSFDPQLEASDVPRACTGSWKGAVRWCSGKCSSNDEPTTTPHHTTQRNKHTRSEPFPFQPNHSEAEGGVLSTEIFFEAEGVEV